MTRLDPAGEPSMEDILASIRKIIAEDPPGSRALPEPRTEPAPLSVAERILQRVSEPARNEPVKAASASEPYLRNVMPSLSSTPGVAPPAEAAKPFDITAKPFDITAKPFDTTAKPFDIDAQMAEVLSKTRGGAPRRDVEPAFDPVTPQVRAAIDSLSLDNLTLDNLTRAPAFPASPSPDPRPGFTVARDGFVPDAPAKAPLNAPLNAPGNDPFEFSLGPSPFASRSAPQPSLDTSMPEVRDTRYQDFGTLVPTRPFASEPEVTASPVAAKLDDTSASNAAVTEAVLAAPAVESVVTAPAEETVSGAPSPESPSPESPSPELIAATLKDFENAIIGSAKANSSPTAALASVDTVLAELKSKLEQAAAPEKVSGSVASEPEPVIAVAPVEADMATPQPSPAVQVKAAPEADTAATPVIEISVADIVEIVEPAPIAAPEMVRELEREFVRDLAQEMVVAEPEMMSPAAYAPSPFHTTQISATQISAMQISAVQIPAMQNLAMPGARSMEDTVAELLRPMLRSWLAENMPKIVERALRKEIDDSLHSEHKTAAE